MPKTSSGKVTWHVDTRRRPRVGRDSVPGGGRCSLGRRFAAATAQWPHVGDTRGRAVPGVELFGLARDIERGGADPRYGSGLVAGGSPCAPGAVEPMSGLCIPVNSAMLE